MVDDERVADGHGVVHGETGLVEDRPESEPLIDERAGTALFGLPAMLGYLVIAAAATTATSFTRLIYSVGGVILLRLVIGLAMTIAKRE